MHSLADSLGSQEVSTLAGDTLVVVIGLAVLNFAVSVFKFVRFVAFFANMINFISASQDGIHDTDVVVETEAMSTVSAGLFLSV